MIYPTGLLQSVLQLRSSRVLAAFLSLALVIVSTITVPSLSYAASRTPEPPVVLVFPFTNNAGTGYAGLTSSLAGSVRTKINELGYYRSTGYSVLHPSIQRALNFENTLSVSELSAPTATPDRAEKIAGIVSAPYFLVGNVDTIATDAGTGTVTVTLDGTFYRTDTGAVIKQANVTGTAAPASVSFDPDQIQQAAINSATGKLVSALLGPQFSHTTSSSNVPSSRNHSSGIGSAILLGLAVVLALVIINNHGGHSHSSSSTSSGGSTTTTGGTTTTTGGTTTGGSTPPPPPV